MTIADFAGVSWFTTPLGAPRWFEANWPFSGHRRQKFLPLNPSAGDELLRGSPTLNVDLDSVEVAVRFTGFQSDLSFWLPCFRQQVLVHLENEWVLLFATALERAIRKKMPQIDQCYDLINAAHPIYLRLSQENAMDYIESLRDQLQPSITHDKDEIKCIASKHPTLSLEIQSLGELLLAWGVPNSPSWPDLTNQFPELAALNPYLIDRGVLYSDGTHPAHTPADSAMVLLAKEWLNLPRKEGGPATDNQRNFVSAISKNVLGVRPLELSSVMQGWDTNSEKCAKSAKSAAERLNKRLADNSQIWRVDPSNGGRCVIVKATSIAAKKSKKVQQD